VVVGPLDVQCVARVSGDGRGHLICSILLAGSRGVVVGQLDVQCVARVSVGLDRGPLSVLHVAKVSTDWKILTVTNVDQPVLYHQ
jgi:hypothetical protein